MGFYTFFTFIDLLYFLGIDLVSPILGGVLIGLPLRIA